MYAVICDLDDRAALWAAARLRPRLGDVRLIPLDLIALTPELVLSLGERGDGRGGDGGTSILLSDGTRLGPQTCHGILNRTSRAPQPPVGSGDAAYAAEEMMAIALAFLASFGTRCFNPPDPASLSGRDYGPQGWLQMAALVGLPAAPFALGDRRPEPALPPASSVMIIGKQVFGAAAPLHSRALELACLSGLSLLSLSLDAAGRVTGVSALPNLSMAGEPGADALARLLRGQT